VVGDLAILEAEASLDVVDYRAPGGERVARDPVCGARALVGIVLWQLNSEIIRSRAQHSPHPRHLFAVKLPERRVAKARIRRVAGGHPLPVMSVKGGVQLPDQFSILLRHRTHLIVAKSRC
jgi:hypothetical protein